MKKIYHFIFFTLLLVVFPIIADAKTISISEKVYSIEEKSINDLTAANFCRSLFCK